MGTTTDVTTRAERALEAATRPTDIAGLVFLRVAFGLLALFGATRFLALGWVDRFFGQPTFFFRYEGFEWVPVPDTAGVTALFVVMAISAVGVVLGWRTRASLLVHLVAFAWVEFIDVTNYLNHYYLYTLLGLLLFALPVGRAFSLDARRRPALRLTHVPAWMVWLLRFQVAVVYIHAGLAKAGPDWLLHGQPLNLWLTARQDFPVLGPLFELPATALVMSWAGFLHDLLVPFLLLWRRTRPFAFAALVVFHGMTHLLFNIGMFPFIMTIAATSFLDPSWPRTLAARVAGWRRPPQALAEPAQAEPRMWRHRAAPTTRRLGIGLIAAYCAFQALFPLRTHLEGGDVLWHEAGMRWSWRVMVREKNGTVTYRVRHAPGDRERFVSPRSFLTPHQAREFSGQPDMIAALGRHIAAEARRAGHPDVEVRVDAVASLNGRAPARLIDPTVDLARLDPDAPWRDWILPGPDAPPPQLVPIRLERLASGPETPSLPTPPSRSAR
jgi:vitamin K-dependent gamma-carboxylase